MPKSKTPKKTVPPKEVTFEYIKAASFRVISADGAFGGLSPQGRSIHMSFFSERRAIPKKTIHEVSPEGIVTREVMEQREARSGFIREMEVDVVMDLQTAIVVQNWLQEKIQQLATAQGIVLQAQEAPAKGNGAGGKKKNGSTDHH
jgi:hypothetical protein